MKIGAPNIPGVTPFSWVPSTWAHQQKKPIIKGWNDINGNIQYIFLFVYLILYHLTICYVTVLIQEI